MLAFCRRYFIRCTLIGGRNVDHTRNSRMRSTCRDDRRAPFLLVNTMRKITFNLKRRDGSSQEVAGYPVIFLAGTMAHKLVLHKTELGNWVVSDPKSGAAVIPRMTGHYKGCPVSTAGLTVRQAQALAMAELEILVSRIGSEKFNATLANPKPF